MSIRVENQITTCHQKKYICTIKEGYKGIAIINTIYIKRKGSVNQHIKLMSKINLKEECDFYVNTNGPHNVHLHSINHVLILQCITVSVFRSMIWSIWLALSNLGGFGFSWHPW